jgi:hypothetical protein
MLLYHFSFLVLFSRKKCLHTKKTVFSIPVNLEVNKKGEGSSHIRKLSCYVQQIKMEVGHKQLNHKI